ncbi:hypothetical protein ABZU32_17695 [Sphaerisporangium sp. NPDC005288]|uniref:hypothetical protein n=1 Tax=Sphaerisporangium sp. NPDC005288 TaxID=3155114 RepID=UPI0033B563AE
MMQTRRINELEAQGDAAMHRDQLREAAFLFEQARRLAAEDGQAARAFGVGVRTARCWMFAGDQARGLGLLLELLTDIPVSANVRDIYDGRMLSYWQQFASTCPDITKIEAIAADLDRLCIAIGMSDSRDIPFRTGYLLGWQGRWQEAISQYEIAWSRRTGHGMALRDVASAVALAALRINRRSEARRWLDALKSVDHSHDARIRASFVRLRIALWDNDVQDARACVLEADDAMRGVQRDRYTAQMTEVIVAALLLDPRFGDPLSDLHPAVRRLADYPASEHASLAGDLRWRLITARLRLAELRYAAGMRPAEDLFYRQPQEPRRRGAARLPRELRGRTAAARQACDEAMGAAVELDRAFRCTMRQTEVDGLRRRVDEIARIHSL